jgi:hypothetical protein
MSDSNATQWIERRIRFAREFVWEKGAVIPFILCL